MKTLSRKFFRIPLFFLAGLVLATGFFEMFLRITELMPGFRILPVAQVSLYSPDPDVGYSFRPNANGFWDTENRAYIEINNLGYRGQETADDGADIVFAGHSLTEALQVEEDKTFAFLTGQRLNVKTANLGISGASPAVVVARLRKYMPTLKPQLVVVVVVETRFFEHAAVLQDNAYVGYKLTADGSTAHLSYGFRQTRGYKFRTSEVGGLIYWALDHFRIVNVLNNTFNRGLFRGLRDLRAPAVVKNEASIGTQKSFFDLWVRSEPRDHRLALEAFLSDLADLQAQHKTNVIIAVTGPWEDANTVTLEAVDQAMRAMTDRYGVTIVNLTPFIQSQYPDGVTSVAYRSFRPPWRGGHLNETGHLIYAEALADIIERQKLRFVNPEK